MSNEHENHEGQERAETADPALLAALSELRLDAAPSRDLWSGIEARIGMPARLPTTIAEDSRHAPLASLRTDITPQRDLWSAIESRIQAQRWRRLRTPLTAAVGLAATLVLMLGLQVYRGNDAIVPSTTPAAHEPLRASHEVIAAMASAVPVESALRPVSLQPLAPETRALVRANLKIVATAETQLRRALATDPDSAYLESLLATAQQQKKDLRYALADRR